MSRKDYVEVASILKDFGKQTDASVSSFGQLVKRFEEMFARDNPNFNPVRFENAIFG